MRLLLALCAAVVLAGCGETTDSSTSDESGSIVFTVNRDGWGEIWVMKPSGRERRRLTKPAPAGVEAAGNSMPRWSPSSDVIAYVGSGSAREEDPNKQEVYVMNADGRASRRLTFNDFGEYSPTWSPDGRRIVFVREKGRGSKNSEAGLYVMNATGSGERLLHREAGGLRGGLLFTPAWSPGGKEIAYSRVTFRKSLRSDLYVIASNGTGARKIVSDASQPAWSPDGSRIAFTSFQDFFGETCFEECRPSGEIYVADADGGNPKRLTHDPADDSSPTWSPDAKSIAFVSDSSDRDGHEYELYVVSSGGGEPERITENSVWEFEPDWR